MRSRSDRTLTSVAIKDLGITVVLVATFSISRLARKLISVAAAEFDINIKSNRMSMSESSLRLSAMFT